MDMGMESMGNFIIVDRSSRRTGCDGLMGEGVREREMEVEEHTGIEKEGNEEKVREEEEEEGHAAVIFQGSTYLFFFLVFFLGFWGGVLSIMHATGVVLLCTCGQIWKEIGVELFVGVAFFD